MDYFDISYCFTLPGNNETKVNKADQPRESGCHCNSSAQFCSSTYIHQHKSCNYLYDF